MRGQTAENVPGGPSGVKGWAPDGPCGRTSAGVARLSRGVHARHHARSNTDDDEVPTKRGEIHMSDDQTPQFPDDCVCVGPGVH